MKRTIVFVIHSGFQLLDVAGPLAAFEIAERYSTNSYSLLVVSPNGGPIRSSSGAVWESEPLPAGAIDTVVVSGGDIANSPPADIRTIIAWLGKVEARRIASVCSGAYLLAEAKLLTGRNATTHWAYCDDFARRYADVRLNPERIFVQDGKVWTSAGITTGIDLALALIQDDLGERIARRTAQQMVVHHPRPGHQSQFSAFVELGGRNGRFSDLIAWIRKRITDPITVEALADRAGMSARHFTRVFAAETGMTPAKAVERLRLEIARAAVETSHETFDQIALRSGFEEPGRMRRAFMRAFGQPPQALRRAAAARIPNTKVGRK